MYGKNDTHKRTLLLRKTAAKQMQEMFRIQFHKHPAWGTFLPTLNFHMGCKIASKTQAQKPKSAKIFFYPHEYWVLSVFLIK